MSQPQTQAPEVKTTELSGAETAVTFSESHPHCWVINLGDSDMYASASPNIVPDADGVYLIPAGGRERITPKSGNTIYVYGTGKAMIRGENDRDCPSFKRAAKGGDKAYEFGKNFGSHNLLVDRVINSDICTKVQNGETVTYTIAANKATRWYVIVSNIAVKRGKMYKLTVDQFDGYGRLAISSYNNGSDSPYGDSNGNHFNRNTAGNFTDDNRLMFFDDISTKYFYVVNSSSADEIEIGIWICTDDNRDGENGTNEHSFDIGLYEEI